MAIRVHAVLAMAVGLGGSVGIATGCGSDDFSASASLASGCAVNSDCTAPLACAFGRCHQQCGESRDCPAGQTCLRSGSNSVCQLADESACGDGGGTCPSGLVCSSGACRSVCTSPADCIADQMCSANVCLPGAAAGDGGNDASLEAEAPADASEDELASIDAATEPLVDAAIEPPCTPLNDSCVAHDYECGTLDLGCGQTDICGSPYSRMPQFDWPEPDPYNPDCPKDKPYGWSCGSYKSPSPSPDCIVTLSSPKSGVWCCPYNK